MLRHFWLAGLIAFGIYALYIYGAMAQLPAPFASGGHMQPPFASVQPTISTCGTGASVNARSTDAVGSVTMGADATACTVTFAVPFPDGAPICNLVNRLGSVAWSNTTSAISIVAPASSVVQWSCWGR